MKIQRIDYSSDKGFEFISKLSKSFKETGFAVAPKTDARFSLPASGGAGLFTVSRLQSR